MKNELRITTPTDTTIVITRSFDAPRRLVWEAMFTADKMRRWMLPPPGCTLSACECDARLGGKLRLAWKSADADPVMTLEGEFTEVVVPGRITHTETIKLATGQVVSQLVETHELFEKGAVTEMRITQTYPSKEERDGALGSGMDQGMCAGYERLDTLLAQPVLVAR